MEDFNFEELTLVEAMGDGDCMFHSLLLAVPEGHQLANENIESLHLQVHEVLNLNDDYKEPTLFGILDSLANTGFMCLGHGDFKNSLHSYIFQDDHLQYFDADKIKGLLNQNGHDINSLNQKNIRELISLLPSDTGMYGILKGEADFFDMFFGVREQAWENYKQESKEVKNICGDQVMLQILAEKFNLRVNLITPNWERMGVISSNNEEQTEIYLQFTGNHYNALKIR